MLSIMTVVPLMAVMPVILSESNILVVGIEGVVLVVRPFPFVLMVTIITIVLLRYDCNGCNDCTASVRLYRL